ncbi:MAG TPA: hypothetical protein VIQ24_23285 [Pyrinomonadaceae bacterium]
MMLDSIEARALRGETTVSDYVLLRISSRSEGSPRRTCVAGDATHFPEPKKNAAR